MEQISNPKTEVPTGISMNEKDYLNCLLTYLKDIEKNYVIAMTEAGNETLYATYKTMFDNLATLQRKTFELSFKNGWYTLEKVNTDKLNTTYQKLNQEYLDLGI